MKRTKYFTNLDAGTVKRVVGAGEWIQYFSRSEKLWRPSAYCLRQLDARPFKRITRDQARTLLGVCFR